MKDMSEQMDRDIAIGWNTTQFMDEGTRDGIGFRIGRRNWIVLWGEWVFDRRRWRIGFDCHLTPHVGYGGGLFVHVNLLPLWLSFRLGVD